MEEVDDSCQTDGSADVWDFSSEDEAAWFAKGDHAAWDVKSVIAFWVAAFTVQGALLFTVGSVFLFKGLLPTEEEYEYVFRAWVDYPFMIGAWCFTTGNYLCYFQAVNRHHDHAKYCDFSVLAHPRGHMGEVAAMLNVIGALFYNVNTMSMFGWPPKTSTAQFNCTYVFIGSCGSLCFTIAAIIQGEYNHWRKCEVHAPVLMSHFNFWGSFLFLVAYIVDYNHYADHHDWVSQWLVAVPFTVGSCMFLLAASMEIYMWKEERYGLGYAKSLHNKASTRDIVGTWNPRLPWILCVFFNICCAWIRFGFSISDNNALTSSHTLEIIEKILIYHFLLFFLSLARIIPVKHPFDILINFARLIVVIGFIGEVSVLAFHVRQKTRW